MWLRIIQLKRSNGQALTKAEEQMLTMCETTTFTVPMPIYLYLQALGVVKAASTGQQLIPSFPALPVTPIQGFGGYFGAVDDETHNLYEEFPTLGVTTEGLRRSISDAAAGNCTSSLAPQNAQVNQNLLGYTPLVGRRPESKNQFLAAGVAPDQFPETIQNTGFSYDILYLMSNWLQTTKTFKLQSLHFATFGLNGVQGQIVVSRPNVRQLVIRHFSVKRCHNSRQTNFWSVTSAPKWTN